MATTTTAFTLEANPGTDIWRKPPTTNVFNAPISRTVTGKLKKFRSARVTFWAPWTERYDQAGLLLVPRRATSASPSPSSPPEKWIKTGIEYYQGQPQLSTVGCDRWADWSIGPLSSTSDPARDGGVTLEVVRESDENGRSLWVYQLILDQTTGDVIDRVPLREICWVLADEDEGEGEAWVLDVSPLVARPEKAATTSLAAEFKSFTVLWD